MEPPVLRDIIKTPPVAPALPATLAAASALETLKTTVLLVTLAFIYWKARPLVPWFALTATGQILQAALALSVRLDAPPARISALQAAHLASLASSFSLI